MPILEDSKEIHFGNGCYGYLKIMGEVNPQLSGLPIIAAEKRESNWWVYEYMWELSLTFPINPKTRRPIPWLNKLSKKDDTILVQVLFHTNNTGYSVRALTGTLKPPFMIRKKIKDILYDRWWKITGTATKLIGEAIKIPGAKEICTAIDVISEFEKDSVPTSHAYEWYSKMITTRENEVMLNGVEWRIKREAFENLGNRLMGGTGLIFIKSDPNKKMGCIEVEIRVRISFEKSNSIKKLSGDIWMPYDPDKDRLFRWENVPGKDDQTLKDYLKQNFDIDLTKTLEFEKTNCDKTIKVSTGKYSISLDLNDEKTKVNLKIKRDDVKTTKEYTGKHIISLGLNDEKTKVNLKINDVRTDEFIVKKGKGKDKDMLNIYEKRVCLAIAPLCCGTGGSTNS